mgnify:CR=1 FL=1
MWTKMKKIPFLVVLFASVFLVSGCGEYTRIQKTQDYEYKYEAAKALYIEGKYSRASQLLGDVLAILKGTAYGEECLYMLAMCAYNSKDYESASSYFRKYYDLYRNTQLKEQSHNMIYLLQDKLVEKEYLAAKMYFDLGTYRGNSTFGGSNYEACIVTAQNALKDYPFATTERREELSILILRSRFQLASQSVIEKRMERFRNVIDEFYAFANDFPESKFLKEAQDLYDRADKVVKKKNVGILEELKKEIVPLSEK